MVLVGRLSEGGVFVQGLLEDGRAVATRILAFVALPACILLVLGH
jgi:hypothetical protein